MNRQFFTAFLAMTCFSGIHAATVDTVSIASNAMHKSFKCVVISPEASGGASSSFPVVYLLHGYSGGYGIWIKRVPDLMRYADDYKMIIVCPDGHYNSWYFDSPVNSAMRYETYIAIEVPAYIDSHYPTIRGRRHDHPRRKLAEIIGNEFNRKLSEFILKRRNRPERGVECLRV